MWRIEVHFLDTGTNPYELLSDLETDLSHQPGVTFDGRIVGSSDAEIYIIAADKDAESAFASIEGRFAGRFHSLILVRELQRRERKRFGRLRVGDVFAIPLDTRRWGYLLYLGILPLDESQAVTALRLSTTDQIASIEECALASALPWLFEPTLTGIDGPNARVWGLQKVGSLPYSTPRMRFRTSTVQIVTGFEGGTDWRILDSVSGWEEVGILNGPDKQLPLLATDSLRAVAVRIDAALSESSPIQ